MSNENQYRASNTTYNAENVSILNENKDFYMKKFKEQKEINKKLEDRIEKLENLIRGILR